MLYKTLYILDIDYYFYDRIVNNHKKVLKLGTTTNEARRKWDYDTYAPVKPTYIAIFRIKSADLTDNQLYLLDSIHFPNYLKKRGFYDSYKDTRFDGGTEWYYDINLILTVENFLQWMGYEYDLILEDPYSIRPKNYLPVGSEEKCKKKAINSYKSSAFRKKCQREVLKNCFNEWAEQSYNNHCKKTAFRKLKINRVIRKFQASNNKSLKKGTFFRLNRWNNIQKLQARLRYNYNQDLVYECYINWRQFVKDNKPVFRPRQLEALDYFNRTYNRTLSNKIVRCLIGMYPGTGKTLVALEIARLGIKRTKGIGKGWLWIVHMNDISATQRAGDFKDFTYRTGIQILYSSDDNLSESQITQINKLTEPFILVASKQLIIDREKHKEFRNDIFIGIIVDECRHSTAPAYYDGINALIANQMILRFHIGLDGTPFKEETNLIYSGNYYNDSSPKVKRTISENGSEIKPLTNEERNNRLRSMYMDENGEYFSYSQKDAIRDGAIVAPKIIIVVVKGDCKSLDYESISNYIHKTINLLQLPYKKGIGWCSDIKQLEDAAKNINIPTMEMLKTHSGNKDHKISSSEQNENMVKFINSNGNINMLTVDRCKEGSNVSFIDFGYNISNQDSIDINAKKQEVARIQRNAPNKSFALYMDFITDDCKFSKVYNRWNIYRQIFGENVDISIESTSIDIPSIERIISLNNTREIFSVKSFIAGQSLDIPQDFNEDILADIYNELRKMEKRLPSLDKDKVVQGYTILQLFRSNLETSFYPNKNDWKDAIRRLNIKSPLDYRSKYKNDKKIALNPQMIYPGFSNLSKEINEAFRSNTIRL